VPNVQWKTPDDGQRNCPKDVEFLGKNKFGKSLRLLVLLKIKMHFFIYDVFYSQNCKQHVSADIPGTLSAML